MKRKRVIPARTRTGSRLSGTSPSLLRGALRPLGAWSLALGLSAVSGTALDRPPAGEAQGAGTVIGRLLASADRAGPIALAPAAASAVATATAAPAAPVEVDASVHPVSVPAEGDRSLADLFDPAYALGPAPRPLADAAPLSAMLAPPAAAEDETAVADASAAPVTDPEAEDAPIVTASIDPTQRAPLPAARPSMLEVVPAPAPRPFSLQAPPVAEPPRAAAAPLRRPREAVAAAVAPSTDNRTFFEKIFGLPHATGPAMAYAVPQDDVLERSRGQRMTPTAGGVAPGTAVYDISAKVLYLPTGEKLEAHSGLGDRRDDPRYVRESMRGPTPPHIYDLSLREQLFHGVRALRLNPVGGSAAIHNRVGLLAHTFMLGPNGDSNGCVSIRDYDRFLQAYLKGDVRRLVVVASLN